MVVSEMNSLNDVWSVAELAAATGRTKRAARDWIARQYTYLPDNERAMFARKFAGSTAGWIINRNHPLIEAYILTTRRTTRSKGQ